MKSINPIDVHLIHFNYDEDDPVICLLENRLTFEEFMSLELTDNTSVSDNAISWEKVLPNNIPQPETDHLISQPYYESAPKKTEPYPDLSLDYARFQAQQKIREIDSLMEVFEQAIIADDADKYWLDRAFIVQKALSNLH